MSTSCRIGQLKPFGRMVETIQRERDPKLGWEERKRIKEDSRLERLRREIEQRELEER
jgi:hypothetical protein